MKTATKEKPILFSGPMVRAILDGSKTQTRRPVKPQPVQRSWQVPTNDDDWIFATGHGCSRVTNHPHNNPDILCLAEYQPGDVLWVRETWAYANSEGGPVVCYKANFDRRYLMDDVGFRCPDGSMNYDDPRLATADFSNWASDLESGAEGNWRPSIHLPRWAARLFLKVMGVMVERINSISIDDQRAEGCPTVARSQVCAFAKAWDEIYPGSWARNDWVFVYEFKRIERTQP